jgi:hypothetical protein
MGLRADGNGEISELWTGWHGNALVSEAEVLTALKQQFLHATQLLDDWEMRAGMGTEFGEAGAVPERLEAILGSLTSCQSCTARMRLAPQTTSKGVAHHELVPLLLLGGVHQLGHLNCPTSSSCCFVWPVRPNPTRGALRSVRHVWITAADAP